MNTELKKILAVLLTIMLFYIPIMSFASDVTDENVNTEIEDIVQDDTTTGGEDGLPPEVTEETTVSGEGEETVTVETEETVSVEEEETAPEPELPQFYGSGTVVTVGPGGDYSTLPNAISSVPVSSPTTIVLLADCTTTATISIPLGKILKITSGEGGPFKIQAGGTAYHVITNVGELWLENIIIAGGGGSGRYGVANQYKLVMQEGAVITDNKGSGVYNSSSARSVEFIMYGGKISGNTSTGSGGGVYNMSLSYSATFVMEGGEIYNNTSNGSSIGGNSGNGGGGVYVSSNSSFTMKGGKIYGNTAGSTGGGVFVSAIAGTAEFLMLGGEISGNTANTYYASYATSGGGGVKVGKASTFTMSGGKISGNTTLHRGGGVLVSDESLFTMKGSAEISGNVTTKTGNNSFEAIYTGGAGVSNAGSTFNMEGGTISGNKGDNGAGVFNSGGATFNMTGGKITGNQAALVAGGVFNYNNVAFTMKNNATISDNKAVFRGGGIANSTSSVMTLDGGLISGNTADQGGGLFNHEKTAFTMNGGKITGNSAEGDGGGMYNFYRIALTMNGGEISNNTAKVYGGGVYNDGDINTLSHDNVPVVFNMNGGKITGNKATDGGGVTNYYWVEFYVNGGEISGNTAERSGGGFYNWYIVTFDVNGGKISGNTAKISGGGVSNMNTVEFHMKNGEISGNTTEDKGGGVYNHYSTGYYINSFLMEGGKISGNTAESGGGIYIDPNQYNLITTTANAKFSDNKAAAAYEYGLNKKGALGDYPNIDWSGDNSIPATHLLNNYDINYLLGNPVVYFTVTFVDWDDTVLKTENVRYGNSATAPSDPTRDGYTFTGWDFDFANVTQDITVIALYSFNDNDNGNGNDITTPEPTQSVAKTNKPSRPPGPADPISITDLDDNGVPLGRWDWDEEAGDWVYTPGDLPKTDGRGQMSLFMYLMFIIGASLLTGTGYLGATAKKMAALKR